VLVDNAHYFDHEPWAIAADGFGPSLSRVALATYGNDQANWVAAAASAGAPYTGGSPPIITTHPASQTVFANNTVMLSVGVSGTGPFTYQWRYNGNVLPPQTNPTATNATLVLQNAQPSQSGDYQVVVLNSASSVASSNATVTISEVVSIITQPQATEVRAGSNATLIVIATSP